MKNKIASNYTGFASSTAILLSAAFAVILFTGCASKPPAAIAGRVGPVPGNQPVLPESKGSLVVFSACEAVTTPSVPSTSDSLGTGDSGYSWQYTNYKILSPAGKLIKSVNNNEGSTVPRPRQVELPAGTYLVEARADKYGWVTVPVTIDTGQNTMVNLGFSGYWPRDPRQNATNAICFPDGRVIGWRAVDGRQ